MDRGPVGCASGPYALRTPADEGTFPFVFLAYGNGGGGIGWLRRRLRTHGHIMERLLRAGYACAWGRYRTEVELGYHNGGPLITGVDDVVEPEPGSPASDTGYDDLLMSGVSRDEARARTRPAIDRILTAWSEQG